MVSPIVFSNCFMIATAFVARGCALLRHNKFAHTSASPNQYRLKSLTSLSLTAKDHYSFEYTQLHPDSKTTLANGRDLQTVLRVAEHAAYEAGKIMTSTAGKIAVSKTKSNARDLVTDSDVECQKIIKRVISEAFPTDVFLGEEDVGAGSEASALALKNALLEGGKDANGIDDPRDSRLLWIVDPIDGTTNFQAGLPLFCASIGVVSLSTASGNTKPEIIAGVIYNPALGEMTSSTRGGGCYLNGKRLNFDNDEMPKSERIRLNEALINVGFPAVKDSTLRASSRAVAALATKVRGLRMIASASQVMAWVAQRKLSAYISWDLNAWDVAAGMVIVEESGGRVSDFDGNRADVSSRDLIVTCNEGSENSEGALKEEIISVLKENDCFEY